MSKQPQQTREQLERENRDLQMIERRQRERIGKLERTLQRERQLARDAAARAWREREQQR